MTTLTRWKLTCALFAALAGVSTVRAHRGADHNAPAKLASSPDTTVGELAGPFRMSLPAVSKHLRVLEDAGLLARRREGRIHRCRFGRSSLLV